MVKRVIFTLLFTFGFLAPSFAADITTDTCPGAGCTDIVTEGNSFVAIQITGTWAGTITFSSTIDGDNFVTTLVTPIGSATGATTTTGNGIWTLELKGVRAIRVAFTTFSSGTATVVARFLRE